MNKTPTGVKQTVESENIKRKWPYPPVLGGLTSWDPEPPYDKPEPITNKTEIFDLVTGQWSILRSADLPVGIMGGRLVNHNDEIYLLTGQYNGMTIYDSPKRFRAVLRLKYDSNNSEWVIVGELKLIYTTDSVN